MVRISAPSPNPSPPPEPLTKPLNPDAAPYPPPPLWPEPKMGPPSWVTVSRPYYCPQPVVWYQLPTHVPVWAHCPTNYRSYHQYYLCPKAVVAAPPVENVVGPPAGSMPGGGQQEPERWTTGRLGGGSHAAPPRFRQAGGLESWVPKGSTWSGPGTDPCVNAKGKEKAIDLQGRTSLMIRNLPNLFERGDLMMILDEHCLEENKAMSDGHPVWSSYDFLYLPMDFKRRANLGYAFVNFTTEVAALRFWAAFNGFKWWVSRKTCEVTVAIIQGKEGFMKHFRNSVFHCHTNNYLPVVFRPARDGATRRKPNLVGRRSGVFPSANRKSSTRRPETGNGS